MTRWLHWPLAPRWRWTGRRSKLKAKRVDAAWTSGVVKLSSIPTTILYYYELLYWLTWLVRQFPGLIEEMRCRTTMELPYGEARAWYQTVESPTGSLMKIGPDNLILVLVLICPVQIGLHAWVIVSLLLACSYLHTEACSVPWYRQYLKLCEFTIYGCKRDRPESMLWTYTMIAIILTMDWLINSVCAGKYSITIVQSPDPRRFLLLDSQRG